MSANPIAHPIADRVRSTGRGTSRSRHREVIRERVLDALAAFPGDLDRVNVDFVDAGGVQVSMHGHPIGVVEQLRDLLGVVDDAPVVRVIRSPRGSYQVVGYAENAHLRGGISLDWYPTDPGADSGACSRPGVVGEPAVPGGSSAPGTRRRSA